MEKHLFTTFSSSSLSSLSSSPLVLLKNRLITDKYDIKTP